MTNIPGHHHIEGTDLEVVFDRRGDDLVLRVNKGPALIFRCLLIGACKDMSDDEIMRFNPLSPDMTFRIGDKVEGVGGPESPDVPLRRLVDLRRELSALIKSELYGGGNKSEGRAALVAREKFDEFVFDTMQSHVARGNVVDIDILKRAIILETLSELVTLLEQARDAGGGSRRGIKAEMLKLMGDPDRFERFNNEDRAASREIACGMSFFAKVRFNHLHEAIRRRGVPYMR